MTYVRKLATGLFALAPLLGSGALATAPAAAPIAMPLSAPLSQFRHHTNTTVTSDNWAGYAVYGSTYKSVSGSWIQPAVKCSRSGGDTYSSFWVGLDGYDSDSVEQTGTEADCDGATAEYSSWYELYPAYPVTYSNTVKPGDSITASVVFSGTDTYTMTIKDTTEGWTKTTAKASSGDARSSAECIAEAPYSGGVLPLADFGTVTFTSCLVDGVSIINDNPVEIQMVSSSGTPEATTSALSGGEFSIAWNS